MPKERRFHKSIDTSYPPPTGWTRKEFLRNPKKGISVRQITVEKSDFSKLGVNVDTLFNDLIENKCIDRQGVIQKKFTDLTDSSELKLGDDYKREEEQIYNILQQNRQRAELETDCDLAKPIQQLVCDCQKCPPGGWTKGWGCTFC